MERHIRERDTQEDEVIFDHAQFGLLNSQNDDDGNETRRKTESPSKRNNPNKCGNLLRTAALCGAYVSLGLCMAVTGPTLPFLKEQVGVSISEISYIFTARSAGTLGGAFLGGFIMDRFNPYSVFFIVTAAMGISIGTMPWCKHLWMLMVSSIIVGIGNGFLDTGASTLCLQLWGKDSGPYMQSMHFAFAVGGSLAPLLVQAFIAETTAPNMTEISSHRPVRSITELSTFVGNSSDAEMLATTIIQAVNQAPEDGKFSPANSTQTSLSIVHNLTTSTQATLNLTTTTIATTEKAKKPKPEMINGQFLEDPKKFEKIPLVQVEVVPTTIAPNSTTTSTTISTPVKSPENTASEVGMKPVDAQTTDTLTTVIKTEIGKNNSIIVDSPISTPSLNINPQLTPPSVNGNQSSESNPITVSPKINSSSTNILTGGDLTTTKETSAVTTAPINSAEVIPIPTMAGEEPIDSQVTKSRGKSRGPEVPQMTDTTTTTTTTTTVGPVVNTKIMETKVSSKEEDVHPNVVVDYLERFGVTRMHMVYTVIAILVLHTAFAFLFFLCSSRRHSTTANAAEREAERKVRPFRPSTRILFVALLFLFYLMYVGAEVIYAQFLTTFGLESQLKLPTSTANYVTTTFWASFAAARFVAIFFAHFASPTVMLLFNLGVVTIGSIALCIAGQTSVYVLYVSSSLIGIGMASTFATGFCWTEQHLLVTNRISASFSIASSMGEMIFPTMIGAFMETNPMSLPYSVLSLNLLQIVAFTGAWWLARRKSRRHSLNTNNTGYHLARQMDDQ